jgi:hypothetical protein
LSAALRERIRVAVLIAQRKAVRGGRRIQHRTM